jgi:hypothetical protein
MMTPLRQRIRARRSSVQRAHSVETVTRFSARMSLVAWLLDEPRWHWPCPDDQLA